MAISLSTARAGCKGFAGNCGESPAGLPITFRKFIMGGMPVPLLNTDDYLTCADAGEKLGLSADSVRVYCNNFENGETPAIEGMKVGNQWLIHKSEVARYRKDRRLRGRPNGD